MKYIIRREQPQDVAEIREVNRQAFGREQEAAVVDKLRENCNDIISLVALARDKVVGHILFSPAVIESANGSLAGSGLAPLAVLPDYQRQGIGSALARAGIAEVRQAGCPFVIVIGHPEYYPRFGFEPARKFGIRSEWEVPDEPFMILILDKKAMMGISGVAKYRPEWAQAL
jgi:putative acetyltransferase